MKFDEFGYIKLNMTERRKQEISSAQYVAKSLKSNSIEVLDCVETKEIKKPKKKKAPKFKKGSWKQWLYKRLSKHKIGKHICDFFDTRLWNFVHDKKGIPEVINFNCFNEEFNINDITYMKKKHKDVYVYINAGNMMYMKMPISSFYKLLQIKSIIIDFTLISSWDGCTDDEIYHREHIIESVNDLCHFINFHRMGIEGIYDLQMDYCQAYNELKFNFKILVQKKNGDVESYKGDMNDFMKEYGLYQF